VDNVHKCIICYGIRSHIIILVCVVINDFVAKNVAEKSALGVEFVAVG